jgi:hypothetical protein
MVMAKENSFTNRKEKILRLESKRYRLMLNLMVMLEFFIFEVAQIYLKHIERSFRQPSTNSLYA